MVGLAIGAAVILGLAARRARWGHGCGGGPWMRHHHHHRWGGGWGGPGAGPGWGGWRGHHGGWGHRAPWLWAVLERLDLSPAQEKLVRTELEQLAERMRNLRGEMKSGRADVARAVAGETFDAGALAGMFERHDHALAELRSAVSTSLERIHEALDARQRESLADILGGGLFRGMGFGGPYRM
jgi:Spy/CpxP family protein refolding chaperone